MVENKDFFWNYVVRKSIENEVKQRWASGVPMTTFCEIYNFLLRSRYKSGEFYNKFLSQYGTFLWLHNEEEKDGNTEDSYRFVSLGLVGSRHGDNCIGSDQKLVKEDKSLVNHYIANALSNK